MTPPNAVPRHTRPVTSWNGLVEISWPPAATPGVVQCTAERSVRTRPAKCQRRAALLFCTNDAALAPALVAALQCRTHGGNVANALEGVVNAPVGELHQSGSGRLVGVVGVEALGGTKLLCLWGDETDE